MKKLLIIIFLLVMSNNIGFCDGLENKFSAPEVSDCKCRDDFSSGKAPVHFAQQEFEDVVKKEEQAFYKSISLGTIRDITFSKLMNKYYEAADNLNSKHLEDADVNDDYYKNNWVKLTLTEGTNYFVVNTGFIQKKYDKDITPAYRQWLKFLDKNAKIFEDGALAISVDGLRKNIIKLENFIENNCNFGALYEVKYELDLYARVYLMGTDNNPIFDKWESKKMVPEYKASYEKFLQKNKNSNYYPLVKELYDKAKENDFKWDKNFDNWFYWTYCKKHFNY